MPLRLTVDSVGCLQARLEALGLSLKVTQLAGGELSGTLLPLLLGPLRLLRIRVDRSVHCAGPKPRGSQIVAMDLGRDLDGGVTSPAPIRSHGQPLLPRALFGLSGVGEIHLTTFGPCDMALLLIHRQEFLHRADRLGCSALEQVLPRNWLTLDPGRFARLQRYLRQLFATLETNPTLQQVAGFDELVSNDLLPLVLEGLIHGGHASDSLPRAPSRIELVKAAQRWMEAHPRQPIHLEGLCREVHTSRRSLIQGFREHLGMGPMSYLRLHRLHGIRQELLGADPSQMTIRALAAEWGFLNPGHFSRQYAELFGERPSDTVLRGRPISPASNSAPA